MSQSEIAELIAAVGQICSPVRERSVRSDSQQLDRHTWTALEQSGFTLVSVPEDLGGSGGTLQQAAAVLRAAARASVAAPLAETMWLAGWMLASSGVSVPPGPLTAALADPEEIHLVPGTGGWEVDGELRRVPWAGSADLLVVLARHRDDHMLVQLHPGEVDLRPGRNLAGEGREDVVCRRIVIDSDRVTKAGPAVSTRGFFERAALARVIALSGAAEQVLSLALRHASEREQFGRPLAKFQAVQQLLAQLAGETASVVVAAQAATLALEDGTPDESSFAITAAKATASRFAGQIAALGHQVLGAMGFTDEHPLHQSSTRLWAWREEFGNERHHCRNLGRQVLGTDPWDLIIGHRTDWKRA